MKKIVFIFLSFFIISSVKAINPDDFLNEIPKNFKSECYQYYNKIDKSKIWDKEVNNLVYKLNLDKIKGLVITQNGYILPYKYYGNSVNIIDYKNNLNLNKKSLEDYNYATFENLNSKTQNEIILNFDNKLEKNTFSFIFNYSSNNFFPIYYISNNKTNWNLIKKSDIEDFSFKYLKIKFESKTKQNFLENIKIFELNFSKKQNTILLKSFFNSDIEIYSSFNCKQKNFDTKSKNYDNFSINKDTSLINIILDNNPKYNVYSKKDYDNDWVEDELDNCPFKYNPNQNDKDGNGIGDICSDDDRDGLIGYYDNCIYIYNPKQIDVNRNQVGDKCEFDKDLDGIFNQIDNCITLANKDQLDTDKDGIGDKCDNCEYYNPSQVDKDGNGFGDVCDMKLKYLTENDDDFDKIINSIDNCKKISNPNQIDTDKDGIGDKCDNCINIQNFEQIDLNKNGVGDMCEDSDNDSVEGYLDNCINIANKDQADSDNDGIGNLCEDDDHDDVLFAIDNCPLDYNPDQIDIDKDNIGDECDPKDNRFIESNKSFFIGLLVFITVIFIGGIYFMMKKLKQV